MIEEGTTEGSHEEVVGQSVFLGDLPRRHLGAVPQAHHQGTGIGIGDELVVAPAIDLHLVLIETVP